MLRCLGQRQLDKVRCPEAAVPASKARPLAPYRASVVQWKVNRPAKASPREGRWQRVSADGEVESSSGSRLGFPSYNLSVSLRSTAPLVGEPLAKPFTLRGLPKPLPLGEVALRSNDGEGKPGTKEPLRSDG